MDFFQLSKCKKSIAEDKGDNLLEMVTQPKVIDEPDGKDDKKDDDGSDDDDDDEDEDDDKKEKEGKSKLIIIITDLPLKMNILFQRRARKGRVRMMITEWTCLMGMKGRCSPKEEAMTTLTMEL